MAASEMNSMYAEGHMPTGDQTPVGAPTPAGASTLVGASTPVGASMPVEAPMPAVASAPDEAPTPVEAPMPAGAFTPVKDQSPAGDRRTREDLTLLGANGTKYPSTYDPSVLERFSNKHPDNDYWVKFNCPEFTSLCPITGQPDFATIYISYVPDQWLVESKSLKLYLFSYRNYGEFHEDCVNRVMKDLVALMEPKYIEVWGKFLPRGGLSIDPYANYGKPGTRWEEVAWDRLAHHDLYPERVDNR